LKAAKGGRDGWGKKNTSKKLSSHSIYFGRGWAKKTKKTEGIFRGGLRKTFINEKFPKTGNYGGIQGL